MICRFPVNFSQFDRYRKLTMENSSVGIELSFVIIFSVESNQASSSSFCVMK